MAGREDSGTVDEKQRFFDWLTGPGWGCEACEWHTVDEDTKVRLWALLGHLEASPAGLPDDGFIHCGGEVHLTWGYPGGLLIWADIRPGHRGVEVMQVHKPRYVTHFIWEG